MRGMIVRVDGTASAFDVPVITSDDGGYAGAEADRDAIGAVIGARWVQHVPVIWPSERGNGIGMLADETGRRTGKPSNRMARKIVAALNGVHEAEITTLAGDVLFLGWSGGDADLSDNQAAAIATALEQSRATPDAPDTEPRIHLVFTTEAGPELEL